MLRSVALRSHLSRLVLQRRLASNSVTPSRMGTTAGSESPMNAALRGWYNIFGKSTARYMTWLVAIIVAGEYATGEISERTWHSVNRGHTFITTDWSKFDRFQEDEDDDEEEEDEDEEEDDDDE